MNCLLRDGRGRDSTWQAAGHAERGPAREVRRGDPDGGSRPVRPGRVRGVGRGRGQAPWFVTDCYADRR